MAGDLGSVAPGESRDRRGIGTSGCPNFCQTELGRPFFGILFTTVLWFSVMQFLQESEGDGSTVSTYASNWFSSVVVDATTPARTATEFQESVH